MRHENLIRAPYVEEFTNFGEPPEVPSPFYLPNSRLRNGYIDALFSGLNAIPSISKRAKELQSSWKAERHSMNDKYLLDIKGVRDSDLWTLFIPAEDYPLQVEMRVGDRVSVRTMEVQHWLHVGFVHALRRTKEFLEICVNFKQLGLVCNEYTFPVLRFYANTASIFYRATALLRSVRCKTLQSYDRFLLICGPTRSGKTNVLLERALDVFFSKNSQTSRVLFIFPTDELADQFLLRILMALKDIEETKLYESIGRLNEWDRKLESALAPYSCPLDQKKIPLIWITTVWTARVLDKFCFHHPFDELWIDDANRMSDVETLIPITLASTSLVKKIVLTGDSFQFSNYNSLFKDLLLKREIKRKNLTRIFQISADRHRILSDLLYGANMLDEVAVFEHDSSIFIVDDAESLTSLIDNGSCMYLDLSDLTNLKNDMENIFQTEMDTLVVSFGKRVLVSDTRFICTLLSRARRRLILVCNPHALSLDPLWEKILAYCVRRRTIHAQRVLTRSYYKEFSFERQLRLLPSGLLV